MIFSLEEIAELACVPVPQLRLWIHTGKFKVERRVTPVVPQLEGPTYFFHEDDIPRLVAFAATQGKRKPTKNDPFVDDGIQENFTVAQVASLWQYSTDTVQRLFADEEGVQVIGSKNPRAKRPRTTLRIPRAVMNRVKKRLSNR